MLSLRKPDDDAIRRFLDSQRGRPFSYAETGATARTMPSGYSINHTRRKLGSGAATFEAACQALRNWHQLRLGWVDCWPHDATFAEGTEMAILGRAFGLWWLNACRIVYTIQEEDKGRFGCAYGTLPDHIASGEERFLIEMDSDHAVWVDIMAFSRPNSTLARLGYPIMRRKQRRFGNESAAKMIEVTRTTQKASAERLAKSEETVVRI